MSKSLLEGSLAKAIGKGLKGLFYDATLTRTTTTDGPAWDPGSGTTTTTDYPCKAIEDSFSKYDLANSLIQAGDVKVIVLATTLEVEPTTADKITTRGVARSIVSVERDPARATWTCQCRA